MFFGHAHRDAEATAVAEQVTEEMEDTNDKTRLQLLLSTYEEPSNV